MYSTKCSDNLSSTSTCNLREVFFQSPSDRKREGMLPDQENILHLILTKRPRSDQAIKGLSYKWWLPVTVSTSLPSWCFAIESECVQGYRMFADLNASEWSWKLYIFFHFWFHLSFIWLGVINISLNRTFSTPYVSFAAQPNPIFYIIPKMLYCVSVHTIHFSIFFSKWLSKWFDKHMGKHHFTSSKEGKAHLHGHD